MTTYRTVQISSTQVRKFEKLMEENGFQIVDNEKAFVPLDVQNEMQLRADNWDQSKTITKEELLESFKARGWGGK